MSGCAAPPGYRLHHVQLRPASCGARSRPQGVVGIQRARRVTCLRVVTRSRVLFYLHFHQRPPHWEGRCHKRRPALPHETPTHRVPRPVRRRANPPGSQALHWDPGMRDEASCSSSLRRSCCGALRRSRPCCSKQVVSHEGHCASVSIFGQRLRPIVAATGKRSRGALTHALSRRGGEARSRSGLLLPRERVGGALRMPPDRIPIQHVQSGSGCASATFPESARSRQAPRDQSHTWPSV